MFLPIFFYCAVGLAPNTHNCGFMHGQVVSSQQMCTAVVMQQHKSFEANKDKFLSWTAACLKLEQATEV